ncbi:S8 family peptidase [Synechococcus sp. KORDI-100]|uniref:S8 family peptidase n=1 Tax=Synechococcus sp. KORDI-100 TaxID=1280380 RepID=UPI0012E06A64|nr:S8 family peptidase [Synechococcus sp. KORDI-100]
MPIAFDVWNMQDNIDISLWKFNNKKNNWSYISESVNSGNTDEYIFALLPSGEYLLELKYKNSFIREELPSKYKVSFDAKYIAKTMKLPNDPLFDSQWHLLNTGQSLGLLDLDIRAPEAWKRQSASPNITVAVIDGGIDVEHPDLVNNIWSNQNEIPENGIDDDKNGFIDDINGWNFVENTPSVIPSEHGTHVAGIIGAEGNNNIGVSGLTWDVNMMSLDIFGDKTKYDSEDLFDAIHYAVDNSADVINMSIGYTVPFATLERFKQLSPDLYRGYIDALNYAVDRGVTLITSAGNDNSDDLNSLSLPAAFATEVPGFISVAAITDEGSIADYSNFGSQVSVAAPGGSSISNKTKIISTLPRDKGLYGGMPGTSMAAPIVSGAVALMLEKNKKLLPEDILWILDETSTKDQSLKRFVKSSGYLAVDLAVKIAGKYNSKMKDSSTTDNQQFRYNFLYGTATGDLFEVNKHNYSESGDFPSLIQFNSNHGDKILIHRKILPGFTSDTFSFDLANNKKSLQKQSETDSDFVYDRSTGNLYYNQNKEGKGWTDSSKESSLLVNIVDKPNLSESMISLVTSRKSSSISSSPNRTIPLDQHVGDTNFAKYLFNKSGRDFKINYFVDHKGLHENNASMDRGLLEYIDSTLKLLDQNTILKFDGSSHAKADLVIGASKKSQFVGINEMSWGLSVGFDFSSKPIDKLRNHYNAALEIATALGVSYLPEKSKGIYSFEDSIAAWPLSNEIADNFGITSSDFDAINHAWSVFL